jgi:hypothetical protein
MRLIPSSLPRVFRRTSSSAITVLNNAAPNAARFAPTAAAAELGMAAAVAVIERNEDVRPMV